MKFAFFCHVNTKLNFLQPHADALINDGHEVVFFLFDQNRPGSMASRRGVADIPYLLVQIFRFLKINNPDRIISITPKTGLLVSITNVLLKIKHVHWMTGQVWCNDHGLRRLIRSFPDKVINRLTGMMLVDSRPQMKYLIENGFDRKKMHVCGHGSITGVDPNIQSKIRSIKPDQVMKIGVVGRLCKDKGTHFLLNYIETKLSGRFEFHFFGDFDDKETKLKHKMFGVLKRRPERLKWHGNVKDKSAIYNNIDVLVLASVREGFSQVLMEAQHAGVPVISRKIYAVEDTFKENESGLFFETSHCLSDALNILSEPRQYTRFSKSSIQYANTNFARVPLLKEITMAYIEI